MKNETSGRLNYSEQKNGFRLCSTYMHGNRVCVCVCMCERVLEYNEKRMHGECVWPAVSGCFVILIIVRRSNSLMY